MEYRQDLLPLELEEDRVKEIEGLNGLKMESSVTPIKWSNNGYGVSLKKTKVKTGT